MFFCYQKYIFFVRVRDAIGFGTALQAEEWRVRFQRSGLEGKVKFTLEEAMKAQRGSRCIALLFLQPWS